MSNPERMPNPEIEQTESHEEAWRRELAELPKRNSELAAGYRARSEEIERRRGERLTIVTLCMDERTTHTEEALGLLPGEAEVMASAGGKIGFEDFEKIYGGQLAAAEKDGREIVIDLSPHECAGHPHDGCAAFKNDSAEQTRYFQELKQKIAAKYPTAMINLLFLDTAKYGLRPVELDRRDARLAEAAAGGGLPDLAAGEFRHAGNGIYIGDTYRAWVGEQNKYFRLSADNPDIAGNIGIALKVMKDHSQVDLDAAPIILQVDYPEYEDAARTRAAREHIDRSLETVLADPAARELADKGVLRIVKSATNTGSWEGKLL